jgi:hypothetical protein
VVRLFTRMPSQKSNINHLTHDITFSALFIPNWLNGSIANTSVTLKTSVEYLLKNIEAQLVCNDPVASRKLG